MDDSTIALEFQSASVNCPSAKAQVSNMNDNAATAVSTYVPLRVMGPTPFRL